MSYYSCSKCQEHIPTDDSKNRLSQHTLYHMTTFFKDGTHRWNVIGTPVYTLK